MQESTARTDIDNKSTEKVASPETLSVWGLAWPSILANVLFASVGVVALKAVGSLGTDAVAAVGTGGRIFFVIQSIMMAISTGTTALVARAYGAKRYQEASQVLYDSMLISMFLSFISIFIIWVAGEDLLGLFGLELEAKQLALDYLKVLILFSPTFGVSIIFGAAVRAAGDVKTPLFMGLIQNIINIFLLIGLVNGRYGFPELGVVGAAYAGGISFAIGSVLGLFVWVTKIITIPLPKLNSFSFSRFRELIRVSTPAGLEQGVFQLGLLLYFWIISLYGNAPIAAYNVGINILMLSFMVGQGFTVAGATLTGQFLGAENPKEAKRSGWRSAGLTMVSMGILGILLALASRPIAGFFVDDPEVIRLTVLFVWLLGIMQPLMALEFALGGALRGAGDTKSPLYIVSISLVFFRLTFAGFFAWFGFSIEYIFGSLIIDYVVKAILFTYRFESGRWIKLKT
ncbi:MAG: MATE family efflux transporter [Rhodobacterales bacterium]|nr:MATE family efflux transporter [Rhodobacterales bacterium]|tara:strand:- start:279 stop:1652 length:1374 start_codon:yes stop_codon:yes gene_type:complete